MRKGDATRERIVAEAAPLFNQRGFAGCSMADVMEVTGLEKGGLYRHFSSKQELAEEVFRYSLALSVKTRTADLGHIEGAIEKLRYVVRRFVETPSAVAGGCVLMNTAVDADDSNPELRALAKQGIGRWKKRLEKIVADGIAAGEVRADVEPRRIANAIVGGLEGALMISRLEGGKEALRDMREVLDGVVVGIKA
jgi:TetR/AcrR family transcriptional repressor of nem operon